MIRLLCAIAVVLSISGCSLFSEEIIQPRLILKIKAQNNINSNINGLPSPLALRVYQLSDSNAFEQADFLQLFEDDQNALKSGLISKRDLPSISPSEVREVSYPLSTDAKYIAVVAAFADYREAKSKALYKIDQFGLVTVNIAIDGLNLSVSGLESN